MHCSLATASYASELLQNPFFVISNWKNSEFKESEWLALTFQEVESFESSAGTLLKWKVDF